MHLLASVVTSYVSPFTFVEEKGGFGSPGPIAVLTGYVAAGRFGGTGVQVVGFGLVGVIWRLDGLLDAGGYGI